MKHLHTTDGGGVVDLGQKHEASHKWMAQPPPFTGRHLWVVISAWQVADPARDKYILDLENLITISPAGCYWCEQRWTPTIGAQCPAEVDCDDEWWES